MLTIQKKRTNSLTIGDAVREVADLLDQLPTLAAAREYPESTTDLSFVLRSPADVAAIAAVLGSKVVTRDTSTGKVYTATDVVHGPIRVAFFHIGRPARDVRRPVEVTERLVEVEG